MLPFTGAVILSKLKQYWWIIALVLISIAVAVALTSWGNSWGEAVQKAGKLTEQNETLREVIKNVQTADEAETFILDPATVGKYCQCVRTARTPGNCKRFLPDRYADNGGTAPRCDGTD